ncbi:SEL1-like repeat protein [Massilia sp. ZL223]|uniref:SEL1-like repeat protein n=1 Tax=Massilia sp. ZL223 TaxID=2824904 RepID=UPI001B846307|nr:SEL1-like repeat protein [Massilia sp. ZL223]MBQ5964395.1 SEL1-like repeat protein [Massilia sp. ZL223]
MANREELAIIRNARAGQAAAQLELGKLYLFGSAGLPQSLPTALHWLERAARQDCAPAWQLIGNHIPFELAQRNGSALATWYERAYDDGSVHAGLVFAQLALETGVAASADARAKALRALEDAARAGFPHAQWMLAQQRGPAAPMAGAAAASLSTAAPAAAARSVQASARRGAGATPGWPAAEHGAAADQYAVLEQAWEAGRAEEYLEQALPLARELVRVREEQGEMQRFAPDEIALLSRCARLLDGRAAGVALEAGEPDCFWELAAAEHDRHAQLTMGLRCARMQIDGRRIAGKAGERAGDRAAGRSTGWNGPANFKKAIRWLTLAGEQGLAEAWYALSRIYIKPEFSQRNVADAQKYLERAAEMGYREAQLECGHNAWRARRENESNDVRAVYWLQKAAAQGSSEAGALLARIAPRPAASLYTETGALLRQYAGQAQSGAGFDAARPDLFQAHPLLAARLELAALFKLTRAEALLLDVKAADQGHCLVIDIRASYGRSKRRLVLVEAGQERQALDRIVRLFAQVDCGPSGPEGNYRQRLYRLRTLLGPASRMNEEEGAPGVGAPGVGAPGLGAASAGLPGAGATTGAPDAVVPAAGTPAAGTPDFGLAA